LTGTVFFFFFFGAAVFFRSCVVWVCFCPTDAGGDVWTGRVVIPGELCSGDVTAGLPAGRVVTVAVEDAVACGRVTSGVAAAGKAAGDRTALCSCIVR
jgi:hypothetical protein